MQEWSVAQYISTNMLIAPASINTYLTINNPVTDPNVLNAMFDDPFYGLNNPQNYPRWNALQERDFNATATNKRLAWQAELRTYFALNSAQVQELTVNWNNMWQDSLNTFNANLPSPLVYENTFGAAYWQWATGQLTQQVSGVSSIAELGNNAFAGYYEISYFHSDYFNTVANAQNMVIFQDVNLYNSFFSTA